MPYIVVVIDELADLMMTSGKMLNTQFQDLLKWQELVEFT